MLQPQLPQNRDIVHLTIPQPDLNGLGTAGNALGRRLLDAAGEVNPSKDITNVNQLKT